MKTVYTAEEMETLRKVGETLRNHRKRCDMTQEKTAELAHINVRYLSDVERGKRTVSLLSIVRLAQAYGVSLEDIFKGKTTHERA